MSLIQDVAERNAAYAPNIGVPGRIATVDKYQGQQNDFVLLSLVRSKTVGHLRDVRRLVVACSRARLGLFIFGRKELFGNCIELAPTFDTVNKRPNKLQLVLGETARTARKVEDHGEMFEVRSLDHMKAVVGQRLSEEAVIRQTEQRIVEQAHSLGTEAAEAKVVGMEVEAVSGGEVEMKE